MKEIRNGHLVSTIRSKLPNVQHLKLDPKSSGRKAYFTFRGLDFLVTSRLIVKEMIFGRNKTDAVKETADASELQNRLQIV